MENLINRKIYKNDVVRKKIHVNDFFFLSRKSDRNCRKIENAPEKS